MSRKRRPLEAGDMVWVPAKRKPHRLILAEVADLYRGGATVFIPNVPGVVSYVYRDIKRANVTAAPQDADDQSQPEAVFL